MFFGHGCFPVLVVELAHLLDKLFAEVVEDLELVGGQFLQLLDDLHVLDAVREVRRHVDHDVHGEEVGPPLHQEVEQILLLLVVVDLGVSDD